MASLDDFIEFRPIYSLTSRRAIAGTLFGGIVHFLGSQKHSRIEVDCS